MAKKAVATFKKGDGRRRGSLPKIHSKSCKKYQNRTISRMDAEKIICNGNPSDQ